MSDIKFGISVGVIDQTQRGLSKIARGISRLGVLAAKWTKRGIIALSGAITKAGIEAVKTAGKFEQWEVAFTSMLASGEKAKNLMKELAHFAKTTPFQLTDVITNTRLLLGMGFAAEDLTRTMGFLGDVAAGLGVPLQRIALNFGQVKAQGRLTGRELRDFAIAGVPLISQLATQLGVSEAAIKAMVETGEIGFEDVEKAFEGMTGKGGIFFNLMEKQMGTLFGMVSNLKDAYTLLSRAIGDLAVPKLKEFAKALLNIMNAPDFIPKVVGNIKKLWVEIEYATKKGVVIVTDIMKAPFSWDSYSELAKMYLDKVKVVFKKVKEIASGLGEKLGLTIDISETKSKLKQLEAEYNANLYALAEARDADSIAKAAKLEEDYQLEKGMLETRLAELQLFLKGSEEATKSQHDRLVDLEKEKQKKLDAIQAETAKKTADAEQDALAAAFSVGEEIANENKKAAEKSFIPWDKFFRKFKISSEDATKLIKSGVKDVINAYVDSADDLKSLEKDSAKDRSGIEKDYQREVEDIKSEYANADMSTAEKRYDAQQKLAEDYAKADKARLRALADVDEEVAEKRKDLALDVMEVTKAAAKKMAITYLSGVLQTIIADTAMGVARAVAKQQYAQAVVIAATGVAQGAVAGGALVAVQGLEQGGVTTGESIRRVGEKNKPEAVLPLTDPGAIKLIRDAVGGGAQTINVLFSLDGQPLKTFTEKITNLQSQNKQQGRS